MRARLAPLAVSGLALVTLATACSSSAPNGLVGASPAPTSGAGVQSGVPSASSSASPSGPSGGSALTLDQAKAVAKAGTLLPSDLPSYKATAQTTDSSDQQSDDAIATCLGTTKDSALLYQDPGTSFDKSSEEVDSSVNVTRNVSDVQRDIAAFTSAKAEPCIKQALSAGLKAESLTVNSFSLTPTTVPGGFGYTLDASVTQQGTTVKLVGYLLGAGAGQAEVQLSVIAPGTPSVTLPAAVALLQKAATRAKAAA